MIKRELADIVVSFSKKYPVVSITGPRQSGKTTLAKMCFPEYSYVSLENPDFKEFASTDPRRFLKNFNKFVIIDEVQKVPHLFSYIQTIVDSSNIMGQFILTGSQNFLLSENISQSLSGRARIIKLLPFSISEIKNNFEFKDIDSIMYTGCYPPIYDRHIEPDIWFADYIETYIERDVRNIKNIQNLILFQKFLKLCAARVGQLLNLNSIAVEVGISHNTARDWLSILEATYIVFTLQPFFENFGKRIVKQPKLYFYDTGIVCALLGIENPSQLILHYLRGNIFENFIVSEYIKSRFNLGKKNNTFFWQDRYKNEIDLLIQKGDKLIPVEIIQNQISKDTIDSSLSLIMTPKPRHSEGFSPKNLSFQGWFCIKSGETINESFFKNLKKWEKISKLKCKKYLIYNGDIDMDFGDINVISWKNIDAFFNKLNKLSS